jgi:peptidyl-prolyl cis-trans isomerase SurA
MQQKIWNISSDSLAIKTYFDSHKDQYQTNDLESVKGRVMNDFQTTLDNEWIQLLRSKSKIKINKKAVNKLIKYYRKES